VNFLRRLALQEEKLDDSSRLDFVEIARDQKGNKLMFLSEWREFPSAPCPAGKET